MTSVSRSQANLNGDIQQQMDAQLEAESLAKEIAEESKRRPKSAALKKLQKADNDKRMHELKLKGRLLADSSLTTYFGKPAFHSYGNGNTNPTNGGLLYGSYLKTHNINPHSGANNPDHIQLYSAAMKNPNIYAHAKSTSKSPKKANDNVEKKIMERFTRKPQPPRLPRDKRAITAEMIKTSDNQFPVEPEALNPTAYRPIRKPKLRADPNLETQVAEDGTFSKSAAEALRKSPRSSVKKTRSRKEATDVLHSTRNSAALGDTARDLPGLGDTARSLKFNEDGSKAPSETGARENKENDDKNSVNQS